MPVTLYMENLSSLRTSTLIRHHRGNHIIVIWILFPHQAWQIWTVLVRGSVRKANSLWIIEYRGFISGWRSCTIIRETGVLGVQKWKLKDRSNVINKPSWALEQVDKSDLTSGSGRVASPAARVDMRRPWYRLSSLKLGVGLESLLVISASSWDKSWLWGRRQGHTLQLINISLSPQLLTCGFQRNLSFPPSEFHSISFLINSNPEPYRERKFGKFSFS